MVPRIAMYHQQFNKHQLFVYTQLKNKTVLFLTGQFSISRLFVYSLKVKEFDPEIGPYQVLPLWGRVDLGARAMKGYSTFPKAPALLEPCH